MKTKEEIIKIMGINLRKARLASNLTIKEVNHRLFKHGNGNRLSEIENGLNAPTLVKLLEMVQLYGVSLDYVFGLSPEYEVNMGCSHAGLIINTMREAGLDIADRISQSLIGLSKQLPAHQSQLMLDSGKRLLKEFMKYRQDLAFSADYADLDDCVRDFQFHIQQNEQMLARNARLMEFAYQEAIEETENVMLYSRKPILEENE